MPDSVAIPQHTLEIESYYDLNDREKFNELFRRYPKTSTLAWLQSMPNRLIESAQIEFYHYEENNWFDAAVPMASAVTAGGLVRITLAAAAHKAFGSGVRTYPRVTDLVQIDDYKTGIIVAKDVSANPHTVDVQPLETGVTAADWVTAITASTNKFMICYADAQPESSDMIETILPSVEKYTGNIQTFREDYNVSGHADKVDVELTLPGGEKKLYIKGLEEAMERFKMKEELGMLITPATSATPVVVNGKPVHLTYALIPKMKAQGINSGYNSTDLNAAGSGFKFEYFVDLGKQLKKAFGDREYFAEMGFNYRNLLNGMLKDFGAEQHTVNFSSFTGGKSQALSFDFKSLDLAGYTYHFHEMEILSHPTSLGAEGFGYPDMALYIPGGLVKDPMEGESKPAIAIRYFKQTGGGSRGHYKVWESGANAKVPTSPVLQRIVSHSSQKGIQVRGIEKFLITPRVAG